MSNFDNFNWQSVEVDDDIITDEAGFLGLEVLDSSQVIVERVGDGWSMKSKKKGNVIQIKINQIIWLYPPLSIHQQQQQQQQQVTMPMIRI